MARRTQPTSLELGEMKSGRLDLVEIPRDTEIARWTMPLSRSLQQLALDDRLEVEGDDLRLSVAAYASAPQG